MAEQNEAYAVYNWLQGISADALARAFQRRKAGEHPSHEDWKAALIELARRDFRYDRNDVSLVEAANVYWLFKQEWRRG